MMSSQASMKERLDMWRAQKGKLPRPNKPWIPPVKNRGILTSKNTNPTVVSEVTETPAGSYTDFKKNLLTTSFPEPELKPTSDVILASTDTSSLLKSQPFQIGEIQDNDKENSEFGIKDSDIESMTQDSKAWSSKIAAGRKKPLKDEQDDKLFKLPNKVYKLPSRRKTIAAIPSKPFMSSTMNKSCPKIVVRQNKASIQRQSMAPQKLAECSLKSSYAKSATRSPEKVSRTLTVTSAILQPRQFPNRRHTMVIARAPKPTKSLSQNKSISSLQTKDHSLRKLQTSNKAGFDKSAVTSQARTDMKAPKQDGHGLGNKARSVGTVFKGTTESQKLLAKPQPNLRRSSNVANAATNSKIVTKSVVSNCKLPSSTTIVRQIENRKTKSLSGPVLAKLPEKRGRLASESTEGPVSMANRRRLTWSKRPVTDFKQQQQQRLKKRESCVVTLEKKETAPGSASRLPTLCRSSILKSAEKCKSRAVRKSVAFEITNNFPRGSPTMKRRLSSWLGAKDMEPSTFRHLHCFGVRLSDMQENQAPACSVEQQEAEDRPLNNEGEALQEVLENVSCLLYNACSPKEVSTWLDEIYEHVQDVRGMALYWMCRSQVSELIGNVTEALQLVEQGLHVGAKPLDILTKRKDGLLEKLNPNSLLRTPRVKAKKDVDSENAFDSTIIQFVVHDRTPVYKKLFEDVMTKPVDLLTATPVRRSQRLSTSTPYGAGKLTTPLKPSTMCVSALEDLPDDMMQKVVLVPNPLLESIQDPQEDLIQEPWEESIQEPQEDVDLVHDL